MDPVVEKIIEDLDEKVQQVEAQILSGRMTSYEMYLAQIAMRQSYRSVIADIRKAESDFNKKDTRDTDESR